MKRFSKILVGVDLGWAHRAVSEELSEPNLEAVRQAIWLAKANSASVHFMFCIELSAKAQQLVSDRKAHGETVVKEAEARLAELVAKATAEGVEAESSVVIGKSWLKMIHKVLRDDHDLVIIGTRHKGAIEGLLLGSTAMKLVRKCPCAVWVTKPLKEKKLNSIVVAHDLRPVGEQALELGSEMARLQESQLHIVHAAEFGEHVEAFTPSTPQDVLQKEYCQKVEKTIGQQLAKTGFTQPVEIHTRIESPESAIMSCIKKHEADLIVIGTVARTGISGFITGNTAERLLPRIPCSLLAIKPEKFISPVEIGDA